MDEYQMEFSTGFGESFKDCPACGKEMIAGHSECFGCGVVVDRFQSKKEFRMTKETIGGIDHLTPIDVKKLDKKWKQVVVNYHDQKNHEEFVQLCQVNSALPFAVYHYSKMLEIDKEDDIAYVMRKQALSRLTVHLYREKKELNLEPNLTLGGILIRWVIWIGTFLSSSCIVAGLITPDSRNLVGLGVASMTLFLALFLYRRS